MKILRLYVQKRSIGKKPTDCLLEYSANHNCHLIFSRKAQLSEVTAKRIDFVIHQNWGISKAHKPESQMREYFCVAIRGINYNNSSEKEQGGK